MTRNQPRIATPLTIALIERPRTQGCGATTPAPEDALDIMPSSASPAVLQLDRERPKVRELRAIAPTPRTPAAVEAGDDLDFSIGLDDEVENVWKATQDSLTRRFVDDGKSEGILTDGPNARFDDTQKLRAQSRITCFVPVEGILNLRFCLRAEDDAMCQLEPRRRARTSFHGRPTPGFASASAIRRSSSERWSSVSGRASVSAAMLSQMSSTIWIRSAMLSLRISESGSVAMDER
jgi:hypothetical protein